MLFFALLPSAVLVQAPFGVPYLAQLFIKRLNVLEGLAGLSFVVWVFFRAATAARWSPTTGWFMMVTLALPALLSGATVRGRLVEVAPPTRLARYRRLRTPDRVPGTDPHSWHLPVLPLI